MASRAHSSHEMRFTSLFYRHCCREYAYLLCASYADVFRDDDISLMPASVASAERNELSSHYAAPISALIRLSIVAPERDAASIK